MGADYCANNSESIVFSALFFAHKCILCRANNSNFWSEYWIINLAGVSLAQDIFRCRSTDYLDFGGCEISSKYNNRSESPGTFAFNPIDPGCKSAQPPFAVQLSLWIILGQNGLNCLDIYWSDIVWILPPRSMFFEDSVIFASRLADFCANKDVNSPGLTEVPGP